MDPETKRIMHLMLDGLDGQPIDPRTLADAAFAVMCWALSAMDDSEH